MSRREPAEVVECTGYYERNLGWIECPNKACRECWTIDGLPKALVDAPEEPK